MGEADASFRIMVMAVVIRPSVPQHLFHANQGVLIPRANEACDSTH
jgi:hypothetical protein